MAAKVSQWKKKDFNSFSLEEAWSNDERIKNKNKNRKNPSLVISNAERNLKTDCYPASPEAGFLFYFDSKFSRR
jgi:hypothetical protein